MRYCVYILASQKNGTLYIGRTENLAKLIWDHKQNAVEGFTQKYQLKNLVHVENYDTQVDAANRERQLKKWNRQWKINLIEKQNPDWIDLFDRINV